MPNDEDREILRVAFVVLGFIAFMFVALLVFLAVIA